MTMTPGLRKFVLTAHVTSSVGWLGAVVAYLALAVVTRVSQDAQMVRASFLALEPIYWFVLVPLALASVLIGIVNAVGTPWGLLRHYWVLVKLLLTVFATIILLNYAQTVSHRASLVAEADSADLLALGADLLHPGVGLVVLLITTILSVYKPQGMTPYRVRKQREQSGTEVVQESTTPTPRWVKVFGIIALVLVLAVVITRVTGVGGRHGPGRHIPSGNVEGQMPPSSATEGRTAIGDGPGGY